MPPPPARRPLRLLLAAALLLHLSTTPASASCPGDGECSGHGSCERQDRCTCYAGFTGVDCLHRTCPHSLALVNGRRTYAECGGRGRCNWKTGECQCESVSVFGSRQSCALSCLRPPPPALPTGERRRCLPVASLPRSPSHANPPSPRTPTPPARCCTPTRPSHVRSPTVMHQSHIPVLLLHLAHPPWFFSPPRAPAQQYTGAGCRRMTCKV